MWMVQELLHFSIPPIPSQWGKCEHIKPKAPIKQMAQQCFSQSPGSRSQPMKVWSPWRGVTLPAALGKAPRHWPSSGLSAKEETGSGHSSLKLSLRKHAYTGKRSWIKIGSGEEDSPLKLSHPPIALFPLKKGTERPLTMKTDKKLQKDQPGEMKDWILFK